MAKTYNVIKGDTPDDDVLETTETKIETSCIRRKTFELKKIAAEKQLAGLVEMGIEFNK